MVLLIVDEADNNAIPFYVKDEEGFRLGDYFTMNEHVYFILKHYLINVGNVPRNEIGRIIYSDPDSIYAIQHDYKW